MAGLAFALFLIVFAAGLGALASASPLASGAVMVFAALGGWALRARRPVVGRRFAVGAPVDAAPRRWYPWRGMPVEEALRVLDRNADYSAELDEDATATALDAATATR